MTIVPSRVFAARYKLACFYIANHLFESVIMKDPEIDLQNVSKLQRDGGFFMASLRVVEQLTKFDSDSEIELLQNKIGATGTMYFRKSILTAVIKQGHTPETDEDKNIKKPLENLYDKHFVKLIYDSYFSAYVEDTEPIEYLDKPTTNQGMEDFVSIYELGVFDSDILKTISNILDFDNRTEAEAVIKDLSNNPRFNTYKQFFVIINKCL